MKPYEVNEHVRPSSLCMKESATNVLKSLCSDLYCGHANQEEKSEVGLKKG